ncbi:hypothetical protein TRVL_10087 [Trypanosoma vivax]|nr:hypothetical protein TRVL_10087 [Trypanosoma vivax]
MINGTAPQQAWAARHSLVRTTSQSATQRVSDGFVQLMANCYANRHCTKARRYSVPNEGTAQLVPENNARQRCAQKKKNKKYKHRWVVAANAVRRFHAAL